MDLVEKGINECNELILIFVKSIGTAKRTIQNINKFFNTSKFVIPCSIFDIHYSIKK